MIAMRRALLVSFTGVVLLLLSGCRTTQGEVYTLSPGFERYEVTQGTFHSNGLAWEYRVNGTRVDSSVHYEFKLINLSEQTLTNLRTYPNLPGWTGSAYEAGTMTPGRAITMRWQWSGDRLPNGIQLVWDGGAATIPVWDTSHMGVARFQPVN